MSAEGILFLHLAGVLLFFGGSIAAAILRLAAMRRSLPSEISLLLRTARPAVPLVGGGLLLAVATGFWLLHRLDLGLGTKWMLLALALLAWLIATGAVAGRADRRTRQYAERLAVTGDIPSVQLRRRLRDPVNLALNALMLVASVVVVALMVWKPA